MLLLQAGNQKLLAINHREVLLRHIQIPDTAAVSVIRETLSSDPLAILFDAAESPEDKDTSHSSNSEMQVISPAIFG